MIIKPASKRKPSILFAAAGIALLASCGILPKREPTHLFEPARPALATHADWPQANWSLLIAKPASSVSTRISPESKLTIARLL